MPAAEEAAGGEVSPTPPPFPPLRLHSPQLDPVAGQGGPECRPSFQDPTQAGGGQSTVSFPRTQLGASGHSQTLFLLPHPPSPGFAVQGGGDRGPMEQVLSAVPSPGSGQWDPGALCPCPPDPERARVGA